VSVEKHAIDRRDMLVRLGALASLSTLGPLAHAANAPIRIGQSLPLTGPLAPVVQPIVEGQRALLQEVDARGGIGGARLELVTLDDGSDPQRTADNVRRLVDVERVVGLFGFASVPGLMRALPVIAECRVPLVGVYNGADIVRRGRQPWLFTTTASIGDEVAAMVRTLASMHVLRLGVAYQDNEFGRFMQPVVEAIVKEHGAEIVVSAPVAPDGSNAEAAVHAVADKEPQAVLLLAAGQAALGFLRAAHEVVRVPTYALSLAGTTALLDQLGPAAHGLAVTQVVPYPWRETTPLTRQFAAAMARANLAPSYDRMWGFLNASILVEVLRRAGPAPTPEGIVAAIEHMGSVDLGGYRLAFDGANHHGSRFVEITMIGSNGKYVR
jgi:ABC-type branched-subunit amino acid transport system substrate-binding protein